MGATKGLVLQEWLTECSWKEQTCVLCALRGPDAAPHPEIKAWVRFIRSVVCKNADTSDRFMRPESMTSFVDIEKYHADVLNALPVHYLAHLMHALQIIGYRHPVDTKATTIAAHGYFDLCTYLHVQPETADQMTERLKDQVKE